MPSSITEPPRPATPGTATPTATHPRRTEETDARLPIREHEDQPHKKRDDKKRDPLTLPEDVYDQATLGVQAVIDFLRKFLQSVETSAPETPGALGESTKISGSAPNDLPTATPVPTNPVAARVASAYQHTARTVQPVQALQPEDGGSAAASTLLATSEIRQIHELLGKLHTLDQRGVVGIKLYKADSFLQSLTNAADAALAETG